MTKKLRLLGFSSRSEYIRYLLPNRDAITRDQPTETVPTTSDTDLPEDLSSHFSDLGNRLATLESRVDDLEHTISTCEDSAQRDTGVESSDDKPATATASEVKEAESSGASGEDMFSTLEAWLEAEGPESEAARDIILDAAHLLAEDGPLEVSELHDQLFDRHPDAYGSANALWSATVQRWYEDAPGSKTSVWHV